MRISVPANWQQIGSGNTVTYAPDGGYGQTADGHSAFTHGMEIGVTQGSGGGLQQSTEQLLQSFARTNPDLRRQGGYSRTSIGGREGLTATLSNASEVTGERDHQPLDRRPRRRDDAVHDRRGAAERGADVPQHLQPRPAVAATLRHPRAVACCAIRRRAGRAASTAAARR